MTSPAETPLRTTVLCGNPRPASRTLDVARTVADALRAILDRDLAAVPQVVLWRLASLKDRPLRVALPMVPLQVEQLELGELRARAAAELARRGRT